VSARFPPCGADILQRLIFGISHEISEKQLTDLALTPDCRTNPASALLIRRSGDGLVILYSLRIGCKTSLPNQRWAGLLNKIQRTCDKDNRQFRFDNFSYAHQLEPSMCVVPAPRRVQLRCRHNPYNQWLDIADCLREVLT
jgi:hypothetical protein